MVITYKEMRHKMEIGQQIKRLRNEKNITQEVLANYLKVSPQAVSKWENGLTTPDISLLPEISVFFGIKIDELFRLPVESHYERIENMFFSERTISDENFQYAENFLNEMVQKDKKDARAYGDLAHLYNHRSKSLKAIAGDYAKKALQEEPDVKSHHIAFWDAYDAVCGDGYYDNHFDVIEYYKSFVEKHPDNRRALIVLIENLLVDKRYSDVKKYAKQLKSVHEDHLYDFYMGDVLLSEGKREEAIEHWNRAVDQYPQVWQSYCSRADRLRTLGDLEGAIEDYKKCMTVQEAPRYTDGLLSLAQIYEEQKNYSEAISVREEQIKILMEEHHILNGENIDLPRREIKRLMALMV